MTADDKGPRLKKPRESVPDHLRVIVRPLPKAVFFYPSWLVSVFAAVVSLFAKVDDPASIIGLVWVSVFLFNLLVVAFDFTEERTLIAVLGLVVVVLGLVLAGWWAAVGSFLGALRPAMNDSFYAIMAGAFSLVFLFVFLQSRFDYWEFRPNEVVHRRGVFARVRRYSTEQLRWEKNVPDLLERLLLGAGQLVLTTPQEAFPIVIEHVALIGRIDDRITDILGVKAVVHTNGGGGDEDEGG